MGYIQFTRVLPPPTAPCPVIYLQPIVYLRILRTFVDPKRVTVRPTVHVPIRVVICSKRFA